MQVATKLAVRMSIGILLTWAADSHAEGLRVTHARSDLVKRATALRMELILTPPSEGSLQLSTAQVREFCQLCEQLDQLRDGDDLRFWFVIQNLRNWLDRTAELRARTVLKNDFQSGRKTPAWDVTIGRGHIRQLNLVATGTTPRASASPSGIDFLVAALRADVAALSSELQEHLLQLPCPMTSTHHSD